MQMLVLTLLTFKKVKLISGHPVYTYLYILIKLHRSQTLQYKQTNKQTSKQKPEFISQSIVTCSEFLLELTGF